MRLLPETLFGRAAAALLVAFLVFEAIAFGVVWYLVIQPLARRSADDLAARIVLSAQTWVELPPETRADFEMELSFRHSLELGEVHSRLNQPAKGNYFAGLIEEALSRRAAQPIRMMRGGDARYDWLEMRVADKLLRIGFDRERYALQAPLAAAGVFLLGAALTVLTALILVRQASRRLNSLAAKAGEVGRGRVPARLPETGAKELRELTAAFNRMAEEVRALLENRTVLLSGISHDLRTPITRLRLALSLLDDVEPARLAAMERDLDEMNRLISDMLAFSRALHDEVATPRDPNPVLAELCAQASRLGPVDWQPGPPCAVDLGEAALRRIVGNLLDNARRYGNDATRSGNDATRSGNDAMRSDNGDTLVVRLLSDAATARVEVLDRGPGIPADQREAVFRPFTRLEQSRNREQGGSGLGLAIARQLADAHGWRIELADREGGGLIARLVMPLTSRITLRDT